MSYESGMLLWGASKSIGNVWIVIDGPGRKIALLFDGKNKTYCTNFFLTKLDTVGTTSYLYELMPSEKLNLITMHGALPEWTKVYTSNYVSSPSRSAIVTTPMLTPGLVNKIQSALGIELTAEPKSVTLKEDKDICPVSGEHKFVPYTGLIHSFEYCISCDAKRSMPNVHT